MKRKPAKATADPVDREIGTIRKKGRIRLRIALIYPNTYAIGMSNLGFQTVYGLLNSIESVGCERAFLPENLSAGPRPVDIRTVESRRPIGECDLIAFSIAFENDYINVLKILALAGLPLESDQRSPPQPLVISGGVACLINPEPIAPFIDCFVLGEAEAVLVPFIQYLLDRPGGKSYKSRSVLIRLAQNVAGVYIPAYYKSEYRRDGTLATAAAIEDVPDRIQPPILADLIDTPTCSTVITPDATFADTYLVEVGRGCPHGCRFCAAGFIYRPPRFRPADLLTKCIEAGAAVTDRIGLVGAAVSDLPDIRSVCRHGLDRHVRLSFSSLRADALDDQLLEVLRRSRVKTATIAPEAGSERLRQVINKGLGQEDILKAVDLLVQNDILNVKLYFMLGLPTETLEDIEAVIDLCKKIKHRFLMSSRPKGRMGGITVSLNSFVPKPFTPFQWVAMDEVGALKRKIKKIKDGLKKTPNLQVHADVPRWAYIQAVLSRGDRRVADLLRLAFHNGDNWPKTLKETPLNADFYVLRHRRADETFPWDIIDHGLQKSYLYREYQRALRAKPSPDCQPDVCSACGVCPPKTEKRT